MASAVRQRIRLVWWLLCTVTLCTVPAILWQFKRSHYSTHYKAWFVAGIFVCLTLPISMYQVALHLEHYNQPSLQKYIVRILWMVPIYTLDAWLGLRYDRARFYLDPIRECYEAYVLYNFYLFLTSYLQDVLEDVEGYLAANKPQHVQHVSVMSWIWRPWRMGDEFMEGCKRGILVYVIVRPTMTAVAAATRAAGVYGDGKFSFTSAWLYTAIANNFSQLYAIYVLVLFYQAFAQELQPIQPLQKFMVIKSVVFFTWWQDVALAALASIGVLNGKPGWTTYDTEDIASGLQDFLICIEMFFAALAFANAFSAREFAAESDKRVGVGVFLHNVRDMFDVRDVVLDVREVVDDTVSLTTTTIADTTSTIARGAAALSSKPGTIIAKVSHTVFPHSHRAARSGNGGGSHSRLYDSLLQSPEHSPRCAAAARAQQGTAVPPSHMSA